MSMMEWDDISQHFSVDALATQTQRVRVFCQITVAGKDVTNKLDPYLVSDKTTINARWGDNLIGWRIRPFAEELYT